MKVAFIAVALLVFIPVVSAGLTETIDIRQRSIDAFTVNLDNPPAGNLVTRNITMDQPYSYDQLSHTIIVFISITVTFFENDDGVWIYTVANEDGPVPDCEWELETTTVGGFLAGESTKYPPFGITCLFRESTKAFPHDHTFILNRTILSGTPEPPTHESISIYFESEDRIMLDTPTPFESITGLTANESIFLFAAIIAGTILWHRSGDIVVRILGSVIVIGMAALMIIAAITYGGSLVWVGSFTISAGIALGGVYMLIRAFWEQIQEGV